MVYQNLLCNHRLFTATMLVFLQIACAPPQLGDSEAALAMEDIVSGEAPSRLKAQAPSPIRRSVEYTIDGRFHNGDLYLSPLGTRAGIVLIPGVVAAGKDDSRLVVLATTLARLQFSVLIPEIKGLRRFHTRASDVRDMADAFRYLISQQELVPEGRAGFAGFSYGAGVVLLAALEPDIREQVQFVMGFGGYHDIRGIVTYFTTGYYRKELEGKWLYRYPDPYLKWVFTLSNADLLERAEDRSSLRDLASNFDLVSDIDIDNTLTNFAPDAKALFELLVNENPEKVSGLIDRLSPKMLNELHGINPSAHDLSKIHANVILLHGRGDTMIPYTESVALAKVLPTEQVKLFIIEGYAHTDVKPKRNDLPQLLEAMEMLLAQRTMDL